MPMRTAGFVLLLCMQLPALAQTGRVTGTIVDDFSGEPVAYAAVTWAEGKGVFTADDGSYAVDLPFGRYSFKISCAGFKLQETAIEVNRESVRQNFRLISIDFGEVIVTGDIAIGRETPVAFSNIPLKRFEEELASRDVAAIVNTTPGAYATQQGGGDGDARVTIRGFSQNNVAVMLDGVPVNDMENGAVFWSNWFGLDVVMQTTQVQRGLGASKLAIPAIGGTINLITRGIEQKKMVRLKQEVGDNGFLRTSLALSTGKTPGGWGFTAAGSFKRGDGWVTGTFTEGYFWYGKVEKILNNHTLSLSGFGAPQSHGQRLLPQPVAMFSHDRAHALGIDEQLIGQTPEYGMRYNPHTGNLSTYRFDGENRNNLNTALFNERVNYYHKPQFTLKDVWRMSDDDFITTIAYLSVGNGGGTRLNQVPGPNDYLDDGSLNVQSDYDKNTGYDFYVDPPPFVNVDPSIIPAISATEHNAVENYVKSAMNNHRWYGLLSTWNHTFNDRLNLSTGLDLRRYRGQHFMQVYDLLGADYVAVRNDGDFNPNRNQVVMREGDKIDYHNDALIQWGGAFGQLEYKTDKWSGFFSTSLARTGYKRIDFFLPRQLDLGDTTLYLGYRLPENTPINEVVALVSDTAVYNGIVYTAASPGLEYQQSDWVWRNGFTVKAGVNYNVTDFYNVFMNVGYLDKAPLFSQVFNFNNELFQRIVNERIAGIEGGVSYRRESFAWNLNTYYTTWDNKPYNGFTIIDDNTQEPVSVNVQGMKARHMGVEWDGAWAVNRNLTLEAIVSLGDWIWNSRDTVRIFYDDGTPVIDNQNNSNPSDDTVASVDFDARGVHVGNAAQTQLGAMIRYELHGAYLRVRYTWFDRHWAEFNPFFLRDQNAGRDSWRVPGYGLAELHGGYGWKTKKFSFDIRGSVTNLLNTLFISDANNNGNDGIYALPITDEYRGFDAGSASVFFGQGRRFNISFTLTY